MKEDVDTLRNDWLTDNVRSPALTDASGVKIHTDVRAEHSLLGRVRNFHPAHHSPPLASPSNERNPPPIPPSHTHTHPPAPRYLERETLTQYPSSHIILLRPSMSFMLMQTADPSTLKDALPDFSHATHIFLPINDCPDPTHAEGGSHWSLLLVSLLDHVAFHYDSLRPSNHSEAQLAAKKIAQLLGKEVRFVELEDAPQQENSSDCGVFVCVLMRHLLVRKLLRTGREGKADMGLGGRKVDAAAGRKELLRIIEGFRKEGERRRS